MTGKAYQYIGNGVYSIKEASKYIGLPPQRLRYWYFGRPDKRSKKPIVPPSYQPVENKYSISFYDLIDAYVVAFLLNKGVKRKTIRSAYTTMQKDLNRKHPFCYSKIMTDGMKIFSETANQFDDSQLYEIINNQNYFNELKYKLDVLDYDPRNHIVFQWNIFDGVTINPKISFGKPVILHTGTTTYVVARAYHANNQDENLVAELYQIKPIEVLNAVRFENHYLTERAA